MAQNWNINPDIGDYVMVGGAPEQTDSLKIASYVRLKVRRQEWLYASDDDFGSDFHLLKKNRSTSDASTVESVAARALQPIADDGRASEIEVTATVATRHNVGMEVKVTDARGETEQIQFDSLGV